MAHVFNNWWEAVLQNREKVAENAKAPLVRLEQYISHYNLTPPLSLDVDSGPLPIDTVSPTFKDLTEENLFALRTNLYALQDLGTVAQWAETLMRFCEVRYGSLKKRAVQKCKTLSAAQLHVLHLAVFLMDYSLHTKDLRFFNTVLKLCDLPWLVDEKKVLPLLQKEGDDLSIALFQFRLLLTKAYVLDQLNKGEAI